MLRISVLSLGVLLLFTSGLVLADDNVANSSVEICPIKIGAEVPSLNLMTTEGEIFNLNRSLAQKPTVLIFYRGSW